MKYIRTKDGVYSEKLTRINDNKVYVRDLCCDYEEYTYAGEVIKQADTIEELCDEFVIVNGKLHQTTKAFNKIKEYFNTYDTFYGAIWTSKGLIYVAKMNEKGELELI